MSEIRISEAGTVQFPMVAHAAAIGWTPLKPEIAKQKRGGEAGVVFRDELEAALHKLNPWMSPDAIRQVIERLEAIQATIEGNREMLAWLRGERQWYDDAEQRHRHVQIIDFDKPSENVFQVTWEWKLKPPARKGNRADVMFVVNGVPVCIVEHKNPKDGGAIDRGVTQLRRYELETPELLGTPQLFNVTHLLDYWYGVTWNANRRFMARWKQQPDESYKFAVQAFFEPTDFLRTLQHWILFYVESGETRKSILRQHQRAAVDKVLARCADDKKKRGLIWHTQGSGKTFTLLTGARLILEDKTRFQNATVILVVDRTELEGQLKGWVEKLLGEMQQQDIPVWRAASTASVQELLATDKRGLILSMIHKFEGIDKDANTRENIFVFIDEAHRSVAKDLGTYMMAAVPNATIIGFTGTPIAKTAQGEGTFKIFGTDDPQGYLDKYSIRESIEDETTLPIRHTMAPSEMTVPAERLDKEFFELAAAEGLAARGHRVAARVLAEHERRAGHAHVLGPHDLVGAAVLQHPVLVDAGLVREGVAADDGLVGLHGLAGHLRQQLAAAVEAGGDDARVEAGAVGPHTGHHHELLEGGVAGALADAVDGALHLPGATAHGRQAVGHREAEVVVAVGAEGGAVRVGHAADDGLEERLHLVGRAVAHRVGQVHRGGAGRDHRLDDAAQEVEVAARGVLGRELHVGGDVAGAPHRALGGGQALLAADPQLALEVQVGGGDEGVDAGAGGRRERLRGAVDVGVVGPRQRGHHGAPHGRGHRVHGLRVGGRGDGEPGLEHVHAEGVERTRHPQLLGDRHREPGRLLAVAQRRVEDPYGGAVVHQPAPWGRHRAGPAVEPTVDLARKVVVKFIILTET